MLLRRESTSGVILLQSGMQRSSLAQVPDGEEQDAYVLGVDEPISEFVGRVVAVIHRLNDVEDNWVVAPENKAFSKDEIADLVAFQEKFFDVEIFL